MAGPRQVKRSNLDLKPRVKPCIISARLLFVHICTDVKKCRNVVEIPPVENFRAHYRRISVIKPMKNEIHRVKSTAVAEGPYNTLGLLKSYF